MWLASAFHTCHPHTHHLFVSTPPGDTAHMWLALTFQRWRTVAVSRLRWRCMLQAHLSRGALRDSAFTAWRKVAMMRVSVPPTRKRTLNVFIRFE
eukprot:364845-Chlamydomonas_euryale.AAC.6